MDAELQAVLFNAVPLLVLAALNAVVAVRLRRGPRPVPQSEPSVPVYAAVGIAAAVLGVLVLVEGTPLAGSVWPSLAAIAVAGVPATLVLLGRATGRPAAPAAASSGAGTSPTAVYRIASVLGGPLSREETKQAIARVACESLSGGASALLVPVGDRLELVASHELDPALEAFLREAAEGPLDGVARAGRVLASRQLGRDVRFGDDLAAAAAASGWHALVAVPVPRAGGTGLTLVFFRDGRAVTDEQVELAAHLVDATRAALERSELFEAERRSRSLAERLMRTSRTLAAELDPDEVLEQVVGQAIELLGVDGASVRLLEDDELVVRAAVGAGASALAGLRTPSTSWLVGDIVHARSTRAIADAGDDVRAAEADPMLSGVHAAYLGVPIVAPDGAILGVLAAYARRPREWRDEEREALLGLAATAAATRRTAALYQGVRHEQQRSEAILANVADGIVAVDRDGAVVLWNQAAERITGIPEAEALGQAPVQLLGRSLAAEGDDGAPSRLVRIRRGSEEVWLSLSEAVMRDPAGSVAGRIFAFRDISDEREVEQMKSDFVSTVSHGLRTPLTSIYGFAETLLRDDVSFGEAERRVFLRYIASEADRLRAIVDRLLSVAQLDAGRMAVQIDDTDVAVVVREAVRSAEASATANGHRFRLVLEDEPLSAAADRAKLGQVLSHLLDNAVRYSPAGGLVTVGARRVDSTIEVRVEDEGVGIPAAEQQRIFRKFYRGESASRGTGAGEAGLGLFLAEGLVQRMGGRIWVESDEGSGTVFTFELPGAGHERE